MKRIVKRTTTTERWVHPGDEEREPLDTADEDEADTERDDDQDEAEDEPTPSRRR